jgi:hypothetical protein
MADGYLQAAYDEFHKASVELGKELEQAPHSQQAQLLRKRVKSLRKKLLSKCHDHLFGQGENSRLQR